MDRNSFFRRYLIRAKAAASKSQYSILSSTAFYSLSFLFQQSSKLTQVLDSRLSIESTTHRIECCRWHKIVLSHEIITSNENTDEVLDDVVEIIAVVHPPFQIRPPGFHVQAGFPGAQGQIIVLAIPGARGSRG